MKRNLSSVSFRRLPYRIFILLTCMISLISCRKSENIFRDFSGPSHYPADVVDKWMTLQLRLIRNATGIGNGAFSRPVAYAGIAAYESIDPGITSWKKKYNGLSGLPVTDKNQSYFWPASVNAALATVNRSFFTTVNSKPVDISDIDSLENAINSSFVNENPVRVNRSTGFGKSDRKSVV